MISYEVSIGLIVLPVAMLAKSFNLKDIILSQISV
jgi:NADH:ubiquinone oxidoreductase subunit H